MSLRSSVSLTRCLPVPKIENKLKYVCARLKSGCTQGNNSRPLYKQEVLNLQRTERTMLLFRNYLLDKREEEQSIQQEAQSDSSLIERETNNVDFSLDGATTADLLILQSKLLAAESRIKLMLCKKQKAKVIVNKLKAREQATIQKAAARLATLNEEQLQQETTSKVGLCFL